MPLYFFSPTLVQMAKSTRAAVNQTDSDVKNFNKLRFIRNDFNSGNMKSLRQIFDVVSEGWFARQMNMGFTTLKNKTHAPGNFSINEIKKMARLIDVEYDPFLKFISKLSEEHPKPVRRRSR